jgi:tetratricopeptide (TPR) repeat protein
MKTKILNSVIVFLIITLSSCSDFLNLEPDYLINEESFYKTTIDFEASVIGSYASLQEATYAFLALTELTTDNLTVTLQSPGVSELECDEVRLSSNNEYIHSIWNSYYGAISRSNNLLERLENAPIPDQEKNQFRGEAYFVRGYAYFNLVRLFGPVQLVDKAFRSPNEIAASDMSRKPVNDIYDFIIRDLEQASDLLHGLTMPGKGRASWGAAEALLGKVYLTQKEFGKAGTILKSVIDSRQYALVNNYAGLFDKQNDDLPESLFEIKYLSGNVGEGNSFALHFVPTAYGGMALFPGNQLGGGRLSPTTDMANAYEYGDLRKNASISDSVPMSDGSTVRILYGKKFVDFTASNIADMENNFTVLRYADVLLMYAEVLNETGKTVDAQSYINLVRRRAGLTDISGLSKEQVSLALEKERRVEFLYEGHRWFDLVRTGRAVIALNKYFSDSGFSYSVEDYETLMPIPQREIDINPALEQNPGY